MADEVEVTWDDQQNINKFGRLNNRLIELKEELAQAKVRCNVALCRYHESVVEAQGAVRALPFIFGVPPTSCPRLFSIVVDLPRF